MYRFLQDFLPILVLVGSGYALARWGTLSAAPIRKVLRYLFFPALLYVLVVDRLEPATFVAIVGIGVAMAVVGLVLVRVAPQVLKPKIHACAAVPNIACFAIPFLAAGWSSVGLGVACALFVGVSVTQLAAESKIQAVLREPWAYAVAAALFVKLVDVIPANDVVVLKVLSPLAQGTYPLLFVFLGASLYPLKGIANGDAWATVGVRFVAGFTVGLVAVAVIPMSRGVLEAVIVVSLAPPATKGLTLTEQGEDTKAGRAAAVVGTLVALVAMVMLWTINW